VKVVIQKGTVKLENSYPQMRKGWGETKKKETLGVEGQR